jgi:CBS domain-containing protein
MKAREVMTSDVVMVRADTPIREIARLLVDNGISAVPVIDDSGAPIGVVSEGDLIGRDDKDREARRDWWLGLLAEDVALDGERLAGLRSPERVARDVMSGPVVTVGEDTDVREIAQLLSAYHIKRVPVLREGRIVGIVSRADLLRAFAQEEAPPPAATARGGFLSGVLAGLDARFAQSRHADAAKLANPGPETHNGPPKVTDFRNLVADFDHKEQQHRQETRRAREEQRWHKVTELIDRHISEATWGSLLNQAREAAEHGQKEFMLLRFPSPLCSDGGRAINVMEPGWPATLRGEAAEIYLRWEHDLKPHGFHLAARVLDFPGGMPGDIGLFLGWAE